MPNEGTDALHWSAYEHEHIERGSDWFWALGVIAVCAGLTSILFGDFLFAVIILIAAAALALHAQRPPEMHDFEINNQGIRIGKNFHAYDSVISFWVDEELPAPLLLVDTTAVMAPNLIIPLGDIKPETIRMLLREKVDEVPMKEPLAHKILEFFGF